MSLRSRRRARSVLSCTVKYLKDERHSWRFVQKIIYEFDLVQLAHYITKYDGLMAGNNICFRRNHGSRKKRVRFAFFHAYE